MIFDFRNLTRFEVEKNFFQKIIQRLVLLKTTLRNFEISLVLMDDAKIQQLNRQYRYENKSTDILSFNLGKFGQNQIAEIFISIEKARIQAKEMGHSLNQELAILFVHGVLHILGYGDETERERQKMFHTQNKILKSLGQI